MDKPREWSLAIAHSSDVAAARRIAREAAIAIGFDAMASEEIALVVSELASNLIRHAGGGTISLVSLAEDDGRGIWIEATDSGPGIADVEEALRDGFSTAGSLGYGFGVVNRFMDRLEITSQPGRGTRVICRRWIKPPPVQVGTCPLVVGVATRPHPRELVNGDTFVVKHWAGRLLVGVIDGLGHGAGAHRAAQTARQFVESHFDQPLEEIFRGVDRSCRSTRGVVMALARFDWTSAVMTFASIGNIEARVFESPAPVNLIVRRGVLGAGAPNPVVTEHPWQPQWVLVLHTDGLTTHWQWADVQDLAGNPAPTLATGLLQRLAKEDDDATVVVVRGGAP